MDFQGRASKEGNDGDASSSTTPEWVNSPTSSITSSINQASPLPRVHGLGHHGHCHRREMSPTAIRLQPREPVDHEFEELVAKRRELLERVQLMNYFDNPSRLESIRSNVFKLVSPLQESVRETSFYKKVDNALEKRTFEKSTKSKSANYLYQFRTDENENVIFRGNDIVGEEIDPSSFQANPKVYGFFSFFYAPPPPPTRVRFPEEIEERARRLPDVAGKDREVRRATGFRARSRRHRSRYDAKRHKKVIDPELDDIGSPSGCFDMCVNKCLFGFEQDNVPPKLKRGEFSLAYNKAMTLFASNIELAGEFVEGNLITIKGAEDIFKFPDGSDPITTDLNFICGQLWIFAFGIHDLFQAEDKTQMPTKSEFEKLVENFGIIADVVATITLKMDVYAKTHVIHSKEWMSTLKSTQKTVDQVRIDHIKVKVPKRGKVLHILKLKPSQLSKDVNQLKIISRTKTEYYGYINTWERFDHLPKYIRLNALADLLETCSDSINRIGTQVRFFVDDMSNAKFEEDDPHFITRLYLIDDLLKYFDQSKETTKVHKKNLVECMVHLATDVQNLIRRGQHFIEHVFEMNDMIQLCYDYMRAEYAVNLNTKLDTVSISQSRKSVTPFMKCTCCNPNSSIRFSYKPEMFYATEFSNVFKVQSLRAIPHMELMLKASDEKTKIGIKIEFAESKENIEGLVKFSEDREWKIADVNGIPKIESKRHGTLNRVSTSSSVMAFPTTSIMPTVIEKDGTGTGSPQPTPSPSLQIEPPAMPHSILKKTSGPILVDRTVIMAGKGESAKEDEGKVFTDEPSKVEPNIVEAEPKVELIKPSITVAALELPEESMRQEEPTKPVKSAGGKEPKSGSGKKTQK